MEKGVVKYFGAPFFKKAVLFGQYQTLPKFSRLGPENSKNFQGETTNDGVQPFRFRNGTLANLA